MKQNRDSPTASLDAAARDSATEKRGARLGVHIASSLLILFGVLIMASTAGTTSSAKFQAELFPGYLRALLGGCLVGCGSAMALRRELARQVFLACFPVAVLALGAAFPLVLWIQDIPYTALGFLVYAPLVFLLTRSEAVLCFSHSSCGWLRRGGLVISACFLLVISGMMFPSLVRGLDPEAQLIVSTSLTILLVQYASGMVAVGIPTRYQGTSGGRTQPGDWLAAAGTGVSLVLLVLFRIYRPDLSTTSSLARVTSVDFSQGTKVLQFTCREFIDQYAFWILEHGDMDMSKTLKGMGYLENAEALHRMAQLNGLTPPFPSDEHTSSLIRREGYHKVLVSPDGRYSIHWVYLSAAP